MMKDAPNIRISVNQKFTPLKNISCNTCFLLLEFVYKNKIILLCMGFLVYATSFIKFIEYEKIYFTDAVLHPYIFAIASAT